jgi:hypothetical protein
MDKECSCCGAEGPTHAHHILPKALGGDDRPSNLVEVCPNCHWKIHGRKTRGTDWRNLQAEGIAKAKAENKYKGRPPDKDLHAKIKQLHSEGWPPSKISRRLNCGVATVYRNRD